MNSTEKTSRIEKTVTVERYRIPTTRDGNQTFVPHDGELEDQQFNVEENFPFSNNHGAVVIIFGHTRFFIWKRSWIIAVKEGEKTRFLTPRTS
jgi:hypothetical protein